MTTTLLSRPERPPVRPGIPLLYNGDRLSQPEFHRRYEAMPDGVKAELIGGRVYMASPVGQLHGDPHARLVGALTVYEAGTPGVRVSDNATVVLAEDSEPQPDLHLRLEPACGGRVRPNAKGILVGAPELVIEVAHSSEAIDLDEKRRDYERAGVSEYLVLCIREGVLRPFDLKSGRELAVEPDGIYRSNVFPGLWIDGDAALTGDTARLLNVAQQGLATPKHAAFAAKLQAAAAAKRRPGGSGGRRKRKG